MKTIEVSESGYTYIKSAQSGEDDVLVYGAIADALTTISYIIHVGRDNPDISFYTDELLRVMATLSEYNYLYKALSETSDNKSGHYTFIEQEIEEGKN